MTTVEDIEKAIAQLTSAEYEELRHWFDEYSRPHLVDSQIDAQVMRDLDAGHFDERIQRALVDHRAGRTQPL